MRFGIARSISGVNERWDGDLSVPTQIDRGANAAPTLKIREMPEDERPREKLIARGAAALTDPELIAILLRTGVPGANAVEVARQLLQEIRFSWRLEPVHREGNRVDSRNRNAKAMQLVAAFGLGQRLARESLARKKIDSPELVYDLVAAEMRTLHKESLRVILLDTTISSAAHGRSFARQRERKHRASPRCFPSRDDFVRLRGHRGAQSSVR